MFLLVSLFLSAGSVFVGTDGVGNTTPAATAPFGMVQAGPDTSSSASRFEFGKRHCSGYQMKDPFVWRFSQTHVSGMGCPAGGNFGLLPVVDESGLPYRGELMAKATEKAMPGKYHVQLENGVRVEITAGKYSAKYVLFYPKGASQLLLFDLDWALAEPAQWNEGGAESPWDRTVKGCSCRFADTRNIRGYQRLRMYVEYTLYYAALFSRDIVSRKKLREADGLRGDVWLFNFGKSDGEPLVFTIALSMKNDDDARTRLSDAADTAGEWDEWFSRVEIDSRTEDVVKRNFRAAMYHLAVHPNQIAGEGANARYVNFSLWDTFRAAHPLYTILAPERIDGFISSFLTEYESRGYLPILSLWGRDTHCMIGHHAVPVAVDAFLKGFRGFDAGKLGEAIIDSLRYDHPPESISTWGLTKEDWLLYERYGYYPFDMLRMRFRNQTVKGESVSRTLECAYDDACAARFFEKKGDASNAQFFRSRSVFWKNVFDGRTGFMRGKDSKGRWREPFDPADIGYGPWAERDFTEGNSYQYTWHVMHDPETLVQLIGGREKTGRRLDDLFNTEAKQSSYDVSGLIGQYAHGNEVSHHIAYFYRYSDRIERMPEVLEKICRTQYSPHPDGLAGNDDCGQMSAWYIFTALGFYPFDPCGGEFLIGVPQVKGAVIRLPGGKQFRINVENRFAAVQKSGSVLLNRKPVVDMVLRYDDIMRGGILEFK